MVEGNTHNHFYRRGLVAAHVVTRPGRLVVAFPAGNSGAGLWLEDATELLDRIHVSRNHLQTILVDHLVDEQNVTFDD